MNNEEDDRGEQSGRMEMAAVLFPAGISAAAAFLAQHDPVTGAVVAGYATVILEAYRAEHLKRLRHFRGALDKVLSPEELMNRLLASPRLQDVLITAIQAAQASDWPAKRILLARAVARAATDDSAIDIEMALVRTTASVETVDARLLVHLEIDAGQPGQEGRVVGGVKPEELRERFSANPAPIYASLAVLSGQGLATNVGLGTFDSVEAWGVTPYGAIFLEWLREAEAADSEAGEKSA
jgi:hypothetical protein